MATSETPSDGKTYLYLLHSDGSPLPTHSGRLQDELDKLKKQITKCASNYSSTCQVKVVDIMRIPGKVYMGQRSTPVIAVVKLCSSTSVDWLSSVPIINMESGYIIRDKLLLARVENQHFTKTMIQVDQDYVHTFANIYQRTSRMFNVKFIQHKDDEYWLEGGFTEVQLFTTVMNEHINMSQQGKCHIEKLKTDSNMKMQFHENAILLANQKFIGNINGRAVETKEYDNVALYLIAFSNVDFDIKNFGFKFTPNFKTLSTEVQIWLNTGSKKRNVDAKYITEQIHVNYTRLQSKYSTLQLPHYAGEDYKKMLCSILKEMHGPNVVITFGDYEYVYLLFPTTKIEAVNKFLQMYLRVNNPMQCLMSQIMESPTIDERKEEITVSSDGGGHRDDDGENDDRNGTQLITGVFRRCQTMDFYNTYKDEICNIDKDSKTSLNTGESDASRLTHLVITSKTKDSLVKMLYELDVLYDKYMHNDTGSATSSTRPKRNSLERSKESPVSFLPGPKIGCFTAPKVKEFYDRKFDITKMSTQNTDIKFDENRTPHLIVKTSSEDTVLTALGELESLYAQFEKEINTSATSTADKGDKIQTAVTNSINGGARFNNEIQKQNASPIDDDDQLYVNRNKIGQNGEYTRTTTSVSTSVSTGGVTSFLYEPTKTVITASKQSIIDIDVQAIVNAANDKLIHRGGIAKVIADAAGQSLERECTLIVKSRGEINTGECCVTGPGNLAKNNVKKIIHAVGPVWKRPLEDQCKKQIENCYWNCLCEVVSTGCVSVAFPAISTGVYNAPVGKVTEIAVSTIVDFLERNPHVKIEQIHLVDIMQFTVDKFNSHLENNTKLKKLN